MLSKTLTEIEKHVLTKGLNFDVTPRNVTKVDILVSIENITFKLPNNIAKGSPINHVMFFVTFNPSFLTGDKWGDFRLTPSPYPKSRNFFGQSIFKMFRIVSINTGRI